LLRQIDRLERQGAGALATPTVGLDSAGREIPGEFALWPRRQEIQALYENAFRSSPTRFQGRILKGYVSHFAQLAWDPSSWFFPLWWELRARRDRHSKVLLLAVAAGVQAPAQLGMPVARAKQQRLDFARLALKRWKRESPKLRAELRECRKAQIWLTRKGDRTLARRVDQLRHHLQERLERLTGYQPTREELDTLPLSRILLRAAHRAFDVPERTLHNKRH
jgi:hypothetical protein